eukprot:COSAG01_NODE_18244_length_1090_cov_0.619576_1_plen_63_part_00
MLMVQKMASQLDVLTRTVVGLDARLASIENNRGGDAAATTPTPPNKLGCNTMNQAGAYGVRG